MSDEWWCEPGHGDWCTCLEKYTLCRDGIYHKVLLHALIKKNITVFQISISWRLSIWKFILLIVCKSYSIHNGCVFLWRSGVGNMNVESIQYRNSVCYGFSVSSGRSYVIIGEVSRYTVLSMWNPLKLLSTIATESFALVAQVFPLFHKFLKDDEKIFSLEKYVTLTVLTWWGLTYSGGKREWSLKKYYWEEILAPLHSLQSFMFQISMKVTKYCQ